MGREEETVKRLARVGYDHALGYLEGGFETWKKNGKEVLSEIKENPKLKRIPVVILTTSKAEEDIYRTYDMGVNSFITKPVSFEGMVFVITTLAQYWFQIVQLPEETSKIKINQ